MYQSFNANLPVVILPPSPKHHDFDITKVYISLCFMFDCYLFNLPPSQSTNIFISTQGVG